ncbi:autotransporter outer membrane beta-barrel domain-containing protein [Rhizobium leucaenae]|uniref:Fibronectin-binding autotransporter adhesin n=1 Tax=Rhizobium leucaenae TaxID=29450 RepID=A0A7W7EMS8_9HYPH|nr:autotransporter outer membrane beta-barrel domain-containing protein [Rhizobium leucaenae]MBB4571396.1 fibronectin-binding autotransporter adhesin [Rhizobium leucaenae]
MSSIRTAVAGRKRVGSRNGNPRAALSSASLIVLTAMLASAPTSAYASNECGAPVGGVVTCSGSSYPSPGISYGQNGLTLILNNSNLVAQKTTNGNGAVYISTSATNINDIVVNALLFQSIQSTGTVSNGISVTNSGTAGNAVIRMDTGTVTARGNFATTGSLLAIINNSAGTGNALITLNGGQLINTSAGSGANAQNGGTGSAAVTMIGGSVSTSTGPGLRAVIANTASSGAASVTIGGGTVTTTSGTGILSQAELGSAGINMTGGTVVVQGGANPALNAVVNNSASSGAASIAMSGGTVTNNGSGDGLFADNKGTRTYNISVTGGTVNGGSGTAAAIHGDATTGGTITIGSAARVNAGASGIAVNQSGGAATITTAGTVTGNVNLSGASNVLDITGGSIAGNISGGGNSALKFDLGSGSFTYGAAYAIGSVNSVAMNSGSAEIDGGLATNTLAVNGGTLILNDAAAVASGTMISAGTLQLGNGGASGSITGGVTNNGTLTFDRSDSSTFAGLISGSGVVNQIGTGTTILTANNSYAGGTTINAGTLVNQGTIGAVTVNAGGTFTQAAGGAGAVTANGGSTVNVTGGTISGPVALTLTGGGTASQVNISGGGLTSTAGPAILANGSNANISVSDAPILGFSNGDILQLTNGSTVTLTANGATLNGNIISDASSNGLVNLTNGSVLSGAIDPVAMTIDASSRWSVTGNSSLTTLTNAGTLAYATPSNPLDASTYHTVTVDNYTGNNGTLLLNTALGADASPTDQLVVTGNTAGASAIKITNVGGAGARTVEGIKIIEVGGASNGAFNLAGDYLFQGQQAVIGGAYAYRLYKGGVSTPADGDWYLRSTYTKTTTPDPTTSPDPLPDTQPLYAPGVPLYEAYAGVLQSFNELDTLQQRIGSRSWQAGKSTADVDGNTMAQGIWGRIEAARSHLEPGTSTSGTDYDVDTWKLQAGLDRALVENATGTLIGGLSVHYGTASADISSIFGTGDINTTGYGLGGTLTWYGNGGLHVDAQGQLTWYNSDLKSATLSKTLTNDNNDFGYALSIETAQKIDLGARWSLTPQAQLSYSSVHFDHFTDPYGAAVSLRDGDTLIGRLGLSADYDNAWKDSTGRIGRSHVYGIANIYNDFLDGSDVDVSGTRFVSENRALWGGLSLGGSYSWFDERYSINGEAFARTSLENFGNSYSIGGKLSFNVKW